MYYRKHTVFSDERIYGDDYEVNHYLHSKSEFLHQYLFQACTSEFFPLLTQGAVAMNEKLCTYAQSNLPGGIYWDPPEEVWIVLLALKHSNDLCESILGVKDYIVTAIPNLHQDARSNLTQVKKNKTIKWLDELSEKQQLEVVELAVEMKPIVELDRKKKSELIKSKKGKSLSMLSTSREHRKKNLSKKKQIISATF